MIYQLKPSNFIGSLSQFCQTFKHYMPPNILSKAQSIKRVKIWISKALISKVHVSNLWWIPNKWKLKWKFVSQVVKVHKCLPTINLLIVPVHWIGILSVNTSSVKSVMAYNFSVMVQYAKYIHWKDSKCDCSIRVVDCFIRVFTFKINANCFWWPEHALKVSGNLRNLYGSAHVIVVLKLHSL